MSAIACVVNFADSTAILVQLQVNIYIDIYKNTTKKLVTYAPYSKHMVISAEKNAKNRDISVLIFGL